MEYNEDRGNPIYKVTFRDSNGTTHEMNVSKEIFETFGLFQKVDKQFRNFFDNHIEHSELTSESLHKRAIKKAKSIEEILEDLHREALFDETLNSLTPIQRRRFLMRYMKSMTFEEIAHIEGCSISAVRLSIEQAKKIFSKIF